MAVNYYQVIRQLERERDLTTTLIAQLKACTWLFETLPDDVKMEQSRYDKFVAVSRDQGVEPLSFDEWQPRFGGSSD